ncbi:MAG: hypothetical protein R2941_12325 [Desulfobacterales bacterium]
MKYIRLFLVCLAVCLLSANLYAGEVAQGKCVEYNETARQITIEEYDTVISKDNPYGKSTGNMLVFDCTTAKIGIKPAAGDVLRIAFEKQGETRKALKVMNVSKQDLRKK